MRTRTTRVRMTWPSSGRTRTDGQTKQEDQRDDDDDAPGILNCHLCLKCPAFFSTSMLCSSKHRHFCSWTLQTWRNGIKPPPPPILHFPFMASERTLTASSFTYFFLLLLTHYVAQCSHTKRNVGRRKRCEYSFLPPPSPFPRFSRLFFTRERRKFGESDRWAGRHGPSDRADRPASA